MSQLWSQVKVAVPVFSLGLSLVGGVAYSISELGVEPAFAGPYASMERSVAATGHYARSRALLVEALAEFEQGRKLARPDLVLDPEEWRLSVISRTEELNRVLDPQPRVTRGGVRFAADSLRVKRAAKQLPAVPDGAKYSNVVGEEERRVAPLAVAVDAAPATPPAAPRGGSARESITGAAPLATPIPSDPTGLAPLGTTDAPAAGTVVEVNSPTPLPAEVIDDSLKQRIDLLEEKVEASKKTEAKEAARNDQDIAGSREAAVPAEEVKDAR